MARLYRCNQGGLLVERFSVEEQAVHVEDNGGWRERKLHNVWICKREVIAGR